jgi:Family of unknown function (DUF6880)
MVEQVERLGVRRLAEIVVNHCQRDERLHQTVRIALAASTPGGPLVKMLATEIDAVRTSRHFYGYRESNDLAQELDRIRQGITDYLLPAQPRAAAELLGRLIRLDANVYERSDDSDGVIGDAIGEAVTDCGRAWAAAPERDPKILAAEVFDLFTSDEYGARREVITAFSEALGKSGLDELERMVRERLDHSLAGKHAYRQQALTIALENIADARGDVDGYIAAQRLAGTENLAVKEIGERLLAAGRLEEALHWLDRPDVPEHRRGDIGRLKVDTLDHLGRAEDAGSPLVDVLNFFVRRHSGRIPHPIARGRRRRGTPKGNRDCLPISRRSSVLEPARRTRSGYRCGLGTQASR